MLLEARRRTALRFNLVHAKTTSTDISSSSNKEFRSHFASEGQSATHTYVESFERSKISDNPDGSALKEEEWRSEPRSPKFEDAGTDQPSNTVGNLAEELDTAHDPLRTVSCSLLSAWGVHEDDGGDRDEGTIIASVRDRDRTLRVAESTPTGGVEFALSSPTICASSDLKSTTEDTRMMEKCQIRQSCVL
ncbi:hypothetical protein SCHPADRAFT_890641 [Schizopora paradoxa]|uniref:Uncharacterized protein n=1 Tax=Schizopora paradoxa TaxID=27342 RepID=A0A0H2RL42_9AGAM|nr:hypothetical protein SCHPADRAFT_890641 [Schizopora paradoxa]